MLAGARSLFYRDWVFAFDHETIEVFGQENGDSLGHGAHDPNLNPVDFVQNGEGPVLKDGIGIQYKEPGFHKK